MQDPETIELLKRGRFQLMLVAAIASGLATFALAAAPWAVATGAAVAVAIAVFAALIVLAPEIKG